MSKKRVKITKEVLEMYRIYKDIGDLSSICEGMTGNEKEDIEKFALCWKQEKKKIVNYDVDYEHETGDDE